MRTTLTIDDKLAEELKARARASGKPFKQVVNDALVRGLQQLDEPRPASYRLTPCSLGTPRGDLNLDRALALADALEDDAIVDKLQQRK